MKWLLLGTGLALGGCWSQPHWRNVESNIEDWRLPPDKYEHIVSSPLTYEEIPDYVDEMIGSGWEILYTEPAGPELPARYLVICRRHP